MSGKNLDDHDLIQRALQGEKGRRELYDHVHALALAIAAGYETHEHTKEKLAKFAMTDFHKAFYAYIRRTLTDHGKDDKLSVYFSWWIRRSIEKQFGLKER